jgi:hypothetical protein
MAEQESKKSIRIELTAEQKELIKQLTGKAVSSLEVQAEDLEERIAPCARM